MDSYNNQDIVELAIEPDERDGFDTWISQKEVVSFLEHDATDEYVIIYASLPHVFIHSILLPKLELNKAMIKDLMKWSHNPFSSWGLTCSSDDAWIEAPLSNAGSDTLRDGEQIIFGRSFDGESSLNSYFELNQKISHILDLHFLPERNAWCKLDRFGDIEEVVKIIKIGNLPKNENGKVICFKKSILGEYAEVEDLTLFRMYDFTRYKSGDFPGWGNNNNEQDFGNSQNIFGRLVIESRVGSYFRGFQLVEVRVPKERVIANAWGETEIDEEKRYCSYIAQDWKNRKITEISCNPSCLANYFTKSDLPFEVTPAFFKPEVLSKYKSDRDKYNLDTRSVSCRGAWHLETFDINSAGQVHTYLIYLSHLPYEEQLHWKQFNEYPKAPISERAHKTDFEGEFYEEYDPLPSLKRKLEQLNRTDVKWWVLRSVDSTSRVHYPYTNSNDEWADEILNLDQLLIEGFEEKWLRNKAKERDCDPDPRLRALKLTESILVSLGFDDDHAREIMSPFHSVHNMRSILKGHTKGTEAEKMRKDALKEFGSFRGHFENLCSSCDESIGIIVEAFNKL